MNEKRKPRDLQAVIPDYDALNAKNAIKAIRHLSLDELLVVSMHELRGKDRRSVMRELLKKIASNPEALKEKYRSEAEKGFTILQVGQTGVGKSETINSLFGREVAETNRFDPQTKEVQPYRGKYHDVNYTIYDTPGLGEADGGEDLDREYLSLMTDQCSSPDVLWHVLRLDANRVYRPDTTALKLIHQTFGEAIWDRTLTVFTHADRLTPEEFEEVLERMTQTLNKAITKVTDGKKVGVPAVAVANKKPSTPDGGNWLGELFITSLEQLNPERLNAFFLAFAEDLEIPKPLRPKPKLRESEDRTDEAAVESTGEREEKIPLDEDHWKRLEKKAWDAPMITTGVLIGANIGLGIDTALGGFGMGIPTLLGGIIGGILGAVRWWKRR